MKKKEQIADNIINYFYKNGHTVRIKDYNFIISQLNDYEIAFKINE